MDPFYQNPNGPNATEITNWKPHTIPMNTLNYVVNQGGGAKRAKKIIKKSLKKKTKKTKRSLKKFLKKRGKFLKNNFSMKVCLKYP
jgi:hypothetical protein